jgi:hypothetical protein
VYVESKSGLGGARLDVKIRGIYDPASESMVMSFHTRFGARLYAM